MLASIHPLGERARGSRYALTAGAHVAGSAAAGIALGAGLGELGHLVGAPGGGRARSSVAVLLAAAAGVVVVVDHRHAGRALPGPRRQVDEDWLHRYRGWVYGAGYGAQLGLGAATIVTTAGVYLTWLFALLSGRAAAGAAIGGAFGAARALVVLTMADVDDADRLRAAHRRLARLAPAARRASAAVVTLAGLTLVLAAAAST